MSVLPRRLTKQTSNADFKLFAANGTEIKTFGDKLLSLDFGLRRQLTWKFIVADVRQPIIGADFLTHYKLLVDVANRRLFDVTTHLHARGRVSKTNVPTFTTIDLNCKYYNLLKEYIDITKSRPRKEDIYEIRHYITTKGPPVTERARRLPPEKYQATKTEFEMMLRQGICRPSSSQWASPLHMVQKKNGSWRFCGDYRRLNAVTVLDRYPLRHIYDFSYALNFCKVFTKLDLARAFYQVPVAVEDRPKTAVITPFGLFEFDVMTFGLRNAAQTFQRLIDTALRGLDFCYPYVDDILIASSTHEQHVEHLRAVFDRLHKYGLSINYAKCVFGAEQIEFLGYHIDKHGTKPLENRVAAIQNYPKPKNL